MICMLCNMICITCHSKIPRHAKTVCALNYVHFSSTYSSGSLLTDHLESSQECPCFVIMSYGIILNILRISVCCFRSWTYWSYILFKTTISKFFLASANTKCFNLGKSTCYWNYTFTLHRCLFPQSFSLFETIRPWRTLARVNSFGLFLQNHTVNWSRSTKMLNFILQNILNEKEKETVMTWMNRLLKLFHLYGHI